MLTKSPNTKLSLRRGYAKSPQRCLACHCHVAQQRLAMVIKPRRTTVGEKRGLLACGASEKTTAKTR
eukprot:5294014-Pyramimonas_sp.AAC.1